MSKRINVYTSPALEQLKRRVDASRDPGRFSGALGAVVGRYERIVARSIPQLEPAEWNLLRDVLNGCHLQGDHFLAPQTIALEVHDGCRLNQLDDKWGVDCEGLIDKINAWTQAEVASAVEVVERWWARPDSAQDDPPEREFARLD